MRHAVEVLRRVGRARDTAELMLLVTVQVLCRTADLTIRSRYIDAKEAQPGPRVDRGLTGVS